MRAENVRKTFDGLEVLQIADLERRAYVRRGLLRPADEPGARTPAGTGEER